MRMKFADMMGAPLPQEAQQPEMAGGAPPPQEAQGQGRPQPVPDLVPLAQHPGDLALLAKQYIDKMPPESLKELAIQLYLHNLASDPQVQGQDHARMVVQQHIQDAELAKRGPQQAQGAPQASVGPAAPPPQATPPGANLGASPMGAAGMGAPKMAHVANALLTSQDVGVYAEMLLPLAKAAGAEMARAIIFEKRGGTFGTLPASFPPDLDPLKDDRDHAATMRGGLVGLGAGSAGGILASVLRGVNPALGGAAGGLPTALLGAILPTLARTLGTLSADSPIPRMRRGNPEVIHNWTDFITGRNP